MRFPRVESLKEKNILAKKILKRNNKKSTIKDIFFFKKSSKFGGKV
jgi:hypothetical protein